MKGTATTPRLKKVKFGGQAPAAAKPQPTAQRIKSCPDCGGKISLDAATCPQCGRRRTSVAHAILGWLLQAVGVAGGLHFWFLDTGVKEVHNTGLLNDRLCGLVCCAALFVAGSVWSSRA